MNGQRRTGGGGYGEAPRGDTTAVRAAALAFAILVLSACGGVGEGATVEDALVAGSFEYTGGLDDPRPTAAECDAGAPAQIGDDTLTFYECKATTASGTVHLTCSAGLDRGPEILCLDSPRADDAPAFKTAVEQAAPKDVTWKCEDVDEEGREIGPAFVSIRGGPIDGPVLELGWMTKPAARALARELGARLSVDC